MMIRFFGGLPYDWFNGSLGYAPALIFLGGVGVFHWLKKKEEPFVLLASAGLFVLSLTFRSIDMAVCEAFPLGVHFMWHVLNAGVLYLALRGLFLNMRT